LIPRKCSVLQINPVPQRLEQFNWNIHYSQGNVLTSVVDKHAQEKDEKNEEHRSLPLQSSSHSPVKLKEDLICNVFYLLVRKPSSL
jgi:hypothetical protein